MSDNELRSSQLPLPRTGDTVRLNHPTSGLFTDPNIHHIVGPAHTINRRPGFRVELTRDEDYDRLPDALWVETPQGETIAQVLGYDDEGHVVIAEPGDIDLRDTVQIRG